jgi:hypothetical protein
VDADLDTLAIALYVRTDDWLKMEPERAPCRPQVGIAPRISDAELLTVAVIQALLVYVSEARWLRHARRDLSRLFPRLPGQSGYNKRLRKLAGAMSWLIGALELGVSALVAVPVLEGRPARCWHARNPTPRAAPVGPL